MKTKWIRRALIDSGKLQKDLSKAMKMDNGRLSDFINGVPGATELTYERTVVMVKFFGLSLDAVCAKLGTVDGKTNFTLHHARFVAERFGISMDQLGAKLGEEVFVW